LLREIVRNLPPQVRAWIDEKELRIGQSLHTYIRNAIAIETDFVVIFVGPESVRSEWVKRELDWALEREIELGRTFVLPIILDRASWGELPSEFQDRLYLPCIDFTETGILAFSKRLAEELFSLVSTLSTLPRQALESEDKVRRRERIRKIATRIADDQELATPKTRLTKERLELIVSSLDALRKVELLSLYELRFGKFRKLWMTEDTVKAHRLRIEVTLIGGRKWPVTIDWSARPFFHLQEEYGLGDQKYEVRDVFLRAIAKLSDTKRSEIFSGIEISKCTFT
jgi:hypothetical protein